MKSKASLYALMVITLALGVFAGCSKTPARTDAQIASDVQSKFYGDPAIESRQIQVQASGGVVTLSGNVSSDSERAAAASDAATVAGVRTVVNNLQIQQAQAAPHLQHSRSVRQPASVAIIVAKRKRRAPLTRVWRPTMLHRRTPPLIHKMPRLPRKRLQPLRRRHLRRKRSSSRREPSLRSG